MYDARLLEVNTLRKGVMISGMPEGAGMRLFSVQKPAKLHRADLAFLRGPARLR